MTRAFSFAAAVAVPALLAACAGAPGPALGDRVISKEVYPNYEPISVSVFAGSGGFARIVGTTRDGASAEEIASAVRLPAFVSPRQLRAAPAGERLSGPHLALVFAPKSGATPRKACRGEAEGGQAGDNLVVLAAFCSSFGTPVSEATLTAVGSPSPSDPDFRRRLSFLMNAVMPPFNPERENDVFRSG
ncbi:MAG: hypothetical protein AAGF90_16740 [Pseudomonadota bacterium]